MDAFQKRRYKYWKSRSINLEPENGMEWNNTEAAMEEVGKRPIVNFLPNRFKAALYDLKKKSYSFWTLTVSF